MVGEVGPDAGQVGDYGDAERAELGS